MKDYKIIILSILNENRWVISKDNPVIEYDIDSSIGGSNPGGYTTRPYQAPAKAAAKVPEKTPAPPAFAN